MKGEVECAFFPIRRKGKEAISNVARQLHYTLCGNANPSRKILHPACGTEYVSAACSAMLVRSLADRC